MPDESNGDRADGRYWSAPVGQRAPSCASRRHADARSTTTVRIVLRKFAFLLFALCLWVPALAVEVAGVKLADKVSVGGQTLVLNGAGLRSKIYVGSLYLPQKVGDLAGVLANGPRRIQMTFLRDLTLKQLVGAVVGGLNENNSPAEMAAVKVPTDELLWIMQRYQDVAVKEDDILTIDYIDGSTTVALNGEVGGVIPGEAFNRALTRIWLGDKPSQGGLKKAMLGG